MSVIQVTVSCTVSLVHLTVQRCIQTVCCGFQFALQIVTFNLLLQYVCHSVYCHWRYTGYSWLLLSQLSGQNYITLYGLQMRGLRI
jgi:hypothetical protein